MGDKCKWRQAEEDWDDRLFETDCDNVFQFMNGGPCENKFKFCPYCGLEISLPDASEAEDE